MTTTATHPEPAGTARGAARGGLANMAGSALAGGAGVAVTWIVARVLGPEEAGALFAATAAFVLAGGLAKLGTHTGLVYWPARLRATGRDHLLGACLRAGLPPVVVFSVLLAAAMWVAAPWIARLTAGQTPHVIAEHTAGLRVLAVFVPLQALTDVLLTVTRGYRSMRPTVLLDRILRSALQLLAVGAAGVAAMGAAASLPVFAFAWAVPYLPVVILAGFAARTAYRKGLVRAEITRTERRRLRRDFWIFTAPRAVAAVAQLALQRVDVLLVAALGGLAPAAVYAVAGRFVVLIQFANQGLSQSVQPRLAEALSTGDRAAAKRLYQIATGWLVLVTWPICLLVIAFAPRYLRLFGEGYAAGVPVVLVLAATMLVATGCGMVDMVLAMAGRTSANLANVLIALAVTVGLDVLLIPCWGAIGAAAGLAGAMLVNNLLPLAQVYRGTRLHPFGAGTLGAAALAIGCFGFVVLVPAAVVAAVPAYAAGAWLLRGPLMLGAFRRKS
ncbi:polysaccharide biosynthesis protein [Actinoplanes philippinensis]|uniref:Membrane protein involved in the export of O-antigen and teichoic acid n=1 Tax=Actinoplanes philippinensis TaxID=35752 RepID=A0A1I2INW5_9ACTN|nr:lipopolysaccharide biosynthesis protein [Actinoplanes philippinensis]GIE79248.1 polysaccharide biosynthesis protein [Actinoplanes philippinensis]SFF42747.1 Membrane protein involved in the export of O-antigen and teichoic acid [Actinoplanes philippinensis]